MPTSARDALTPDGEPPDTDPNKSRLLPSVSELVSLLERGTRAEITLVHKAARLVCAEDLARVREGHEARPLAALVARASEVVRTLQSGKPAPRVDEATSSEDVPFQNLFTRDRRPLGPIADSWTALRTAIATRRSPKVEEG